MATVSKQPKTRKSQAGSSKLASSAAQEVKILHKIIETVSYNLNLDEILADIIKLVDSVAKADEIFIYLLKGDELLLRAAKSEKPDEFSSVQLGVGEGITGWVAKHKKMVRLSSKAHKDKRFYPFSNLKADLYEAFLSLPMVYKNEIIGVLNVQHRKVHKFSNSEVKLMQTIASATAGAVESARLYELTAVLNQEIESRKIVEKAKGKMMKNTGMSEDEAYRWIKKRAMDLRKTMKEVAEAVLISME